LKHPLFPSTSSLLDFKKFKDTAVYVKKNTIPLVSKFIVFVRAAKMD
jgi:hypothetical protein